MMTARALTVALLLSVFATAAAEEAPVNPWSGSVTLTSNYLSRGFEQTWGNPALQAGVDYRHASGWFAGSWASNVSDKFIEGGRLEWDVYGGYTATHGDWNYSVGLYQYLYPGARMSASATKYDYAELIGSAGWKQWTLSYAMTVSRDYFGINSRSLGQAGDAHSRGSGYLSLDGKFDLHPKLALALHGGHQRVRHFSDYSFSDGSVALQSTLGAFEWEAGYARAWNSAGVYRNYSTGVVDAQGRVAVSQPIDGAFYVSVTRAF